MRRPRIDHGVVAGGDHDAADALARNQRNGCLEATVLVPLTGAATRECRVNERLRAGRGRPGHELAGPVERGHRGEPLRQLNGVARLSFQVDLPRGGDDIALQLEQLFVLVAPLQDECERNSEQRQGDCADADHRKEQASAHQASSL